eukprot:1008458-Rhodomonas_salina.1
MPAFSFEKIFDMPMYWMVDTVDERKPPKSNPSDLPIPEQTVVSFSMLSICFPRVMSVFEPQAVRLEGDFRVEGVNAELCAQHGLGRSIRQSFTSPPLASYAVRGTDISNGGTSSVYARAMECPVPMYAATGREPTSACLRAQSHVGAKHEAGHSYAVALSTDARCSGGCVSAQDLFRKPEGQA